MFHRHPLLYPIYKSICIYIYLYICIYTYRLTYVYTIHLESIMIQQWDLTIRCWAWTFSEPWFFGVKEFAHSKSEWNQIRGGTFWIHYLHFFNSCLFILNHIVVKLKHIWSCANNHHIS